MTEPPPVRVGDVITVPEAAYYYGAGSLTLEVIGIGPVEREGAKAWIWLEGYVIEWNGARDPHPKKFLVLVSALPDPPR